MTKTLSASEASAMVRVETALRILDEDSSQRIEAERKQPRKIQDRRRNNAIRYYLKEKAS